MVKVIQHESLDLGKSVPGEPGPGVALDSLKPGESGTILRIHADPALKLHLMELGFVTGSPIAFLMSTPFGDPNIYALRGTSIALRKSEASCIRVRT
ncbi:MAG: FeoA family protein [Fibrobacteria bacterium]